MKSDPEKWKVYGKAHPILFDDDCDHPALNTLYWHYSECYAMSSEQTKRVTHDLNAYLEAMGMEKQDMVFYLINALCAEHERIAFLTGLRLGAQLLMELAEE